MKKIFLTYLIMVFLLIISACNNPFWPGRDGETGTAGNTGKTGESGCVHNWVVIKIIHPACFEDGEKIFDCTRCGETYKEVLPALGHDWGWPAYEAAARTGLRECQNPGCTVIAGVGDTGPGGGVIFYAAKFDFYDGDTETSVTRYYLEAALDNALGGSGGTEDTMKWTIDAPFLVEDIPNDASGWDIGTGSRNTERIIKAESDQHPGENYIYAAEAAKNYRAAAPYNNIGGWFLPSIYELTALAGIKGQYGIPNLNYFWSSSQFDADIAWCRIFWDGNAGQEEFDRIEVNKDYEDLINVRAIRAF